jgi:hypothetical protein
MHEDKNTGLKPVKHEQHHDRHECETALYE